MASTDSTGERHAKLKLIIDCDAGIDDAQAIMIALSQEVDVLAITCTFGNVNVDQVSKNVLKTLEVCGRTDIPVYKGAHRAMLGTVISKKLNIPIQFFAYFSRSSTQTVVKGKRTKIETMIGLVHTRHDGKITQMQKTPRFDVLCH